MPRFKNVKKLIHKICACKVEEIVGKVTVKQTKLSFLRPNAFAFDAVIAVLQNCEFSQPGLIV